MVLITKSDIKNGKRERHEVYIPLYGEEVSLRPLTDGEYNKVVAATKDFGEMALDINEKADLDDISDEVKNQERSMKASINPKIQQEAAYKADCLAAAFGLSNDDETFLPSDLKNMRPIGVVSQIAEAVVMISKINDPEELEKAIKEFREH